MKYFTLYANLRKSAHLKLRGNDDIGVTDVVLCPICLNHEVEEGKDLQIYFYSSRVFIMIFGEIFEF